MGRIELSDGDVVAPGHVAPAGEEQAEREHRKRERRRVEDVRAPSVLLPAQEFLGGEPERHHEELEVEPIVSEPEKKVDAEDDRKRTESEGVGLPARPAEKHVERVREHKLGGEKVERVIHLAPVPAPVQHHRELGARLQIVLLAHVDLERELPS